MFHDKLPDRPLHMNKQRVHLVVVEGEQVSPVQTGRAMTLTLRSYDAVTIPPLWIIVDLPN